MFIFHLYKGLFFRKVTLGRVLLFVVFFHLFFYRLNAFPSIIQLGINRGLSNNSVRCIFQDSRGFLWFGTYDGLNRFDGYDFEIFRNKLNDSTSIPNNYIYAINEDSTHNIWIGTGQGIGIYNNLRSGFIPAYFRAWGSNDRRKISFSINHIKTGSNGDIFIGANGWGFLIQRKGSQTAIQIPVYRDKGSPLIYYSVQAIWTDAHRNAWMVIGEYGLCLYDFRNNRINLLNKDVKSAHCMEGDDKGNLWIGSEKGIFIYNILKKTLVNKYNQENGSLTSNNVACLSFDKNNKLWIGTEGGGMNILNLTNDKFEYLLPGENKNMLSSESIFAVYEDKEFRHWIGTLKGGINIIDPQKNQFHILSHDPLNPNSLINNFASSFFEDQENNLWIGTDGGGLSIWNRKQNKFTNFRHTNFDNRSLSNDKVSSILEDDRKNLWIATFGGGINKYVKSNGTFEHYKCINDATGEENINVWLLYEDRNKDLWATTFSSGKLYRFDKQLNRFTVFDQVVYDLISILEDRSGNLWAGNSHQLVKIDKIQKKHIFYEIGKPVRAIYEDRSGNFWLGTEGGGMVLFDREKGKILKRYSDTEGLCNNSVLNILEDQKGRLWLSTFNGLSRFDKTSNEFTSFYQSDGLQSNQFLYSAALKLHTGELVFGGINGFNLFSPDSIRPRNFMPSLWITKLSVNNKPINEGSPYVVKTGNDEIKEIKVPYSQAIFSFNFSALEYTSPGKIMYAYFLEGWDKDWNYKNDTRTVTYINVREGTYLLRIKSTNAEGVWNTRETILKITVLPPWYRMWWALLLYIIIVSGLIYLYLRFKSDQTKLKYEIRISRLKAEKEMEINEKKLSFFTNISHEFRTPLTLIINPIKDLMARNDQNDEDSRELNIVYRNARRLLSLVDQLLIFRKVESETDKVKVAKLNFYNLCHEVYLCFVQQAKSKKIDYDFHCPNKELELYVDREKIEIAMYNLLSNALKYTPEGGKIMFSVEEVESEVILKVADNGKGIPEETGIKLFEKFYQEKTNDSSNTGFGIGLYLAKIFVNSHKGEITYFSKPGKGSTFVIKLGKGKEHFDNQIIYEDFNSKSPLFGELIEDTESTVEERPGNDQRSNDLVKGDYSILIVDDNQQMREYIKGMISKRFNVYESDSAEDGLKLVRQYQPDMIISDIFMGGLSGIDLCKNVKEDPALSHIPVILLTGNSSSEVKLKSVEGGAEDYITKPFEKSLLLARIETLLKNRNNLQKYFYNEVTHKKSSFKISAEYKEFLDKCISIVEKHLTNEDFSIKTLAEEIGTSHSNLYKKVKSISGQSINGFIRSIRLRRAAELLITTNKNVSETAQAVGMNDIKHFREQFNKTFGMNPSEYIEKYRKSFGKNFNLNEKIIKEKE